MTMTSPKPLIGAVCIAAFSLFLASCDEPAGEPVARAQIGDGPADPADPNAEPGISAINSNSGNGAKSACIAVTFEETPLTHCVADPAKHRITTALAADDGSNYRGLSALAASKDAATIAFAVNAGMYDGEGDPIGYYVENSERLEELNRNDGSGNFHLNPNGVFYGSGGAWRVRTTRSFLGNVSDRPQFGTQSGPMLVIDGELHPEFQADGPSQAKRNGVGVDASGKAHFVISEAPLSFGKLARFYRDELKVRNALFLDGKISALWDPGWS